MVKIQEKVKLTLDEARMLVLGCQILLGFQYRSFLENGFFALPELSHYLKLASLCAVLLTMALLMWPASFHQIAEEGEANRAMFNFTTRVMCWAFFPFALATGIEVFTVVQRVFFTSLAVLLGTAMAGMALVFWYGIEWMQKRRRPARERSMNDEESDKGTPLKDKIDDVLTEARVVIPGAQALLGFQLIAMLNEGFDKLSTLSKYVHLVSLLLIAMSMILLMTPAAYHRIVERGEDTEEFWRFARKMLLWSMVPLAAGLSGDLYVVAERATHSAVCGLILAIVALVTFYGMWFGFTSWRRVQREQQQRVPADELQAAVAGGSRRTRHSAASI